MSDRHLRERVREVLRAGRLPDRGPDNIWGGLGTGAYCAVCETSIASSDVELEIQFTRGEYLGSYIVHLRCYSIYEDERQHAPKQKTARAARSRPVSQEGAE